MALSFMFLLIVWIVNVSSQTFNNFTQFPIEFPIKISQHITAVYNNILYVFGGKNGTNDYDYNLQSWSLDLSSLGLSLNPAKNDLGAAPVNVPWVEIFITPPLYGKSTTGIIRCEHQCATLIDNYLYIVAPYGSKDFEEQIDYVYRLDLSQDPPVYSIDTDFTSNINAYYGGSVEQPCVTSTNDNQYIYVLGGDKSNEAGPTSIAIRYNISGNQWDILPPMNIKRKSSGCAVSGYNKEVYIFGGNDNTDTSSLRGSVIIDIYDINADDWTDNTNAAVKEYLLQEGKFYFQCFFNEFDFTILCPGGFNAQPETIVDIIKTPTNTILPPVLLDTAVLGYGLATYTFIDGADEAMIVLIIGGWDGLGTNIYNTTQYSIIYNAPTSMPTISPSIEPTLEPTSREPTKTPSKGPVIPPTSAPTPLYTDSPTKIPTVSTTRQATAAEKTTTPVGIDPDNAFQINLWNTIIILLIFMFCIH